MSESEEFKTILNVAETVDEIIVAVKQLSVDIPHFNEVLDRTEMEEPGISNKDVKFFPEMEENIAVVIAAVDTMVEPITETVIENVVETVIEPAIETVIEHMVETVIEPAVETVIEHVVETVHEIETVIEQVVKTVHEIETVMDNVMEAVLDVTAPEIETTPSQDKIPPTTRVMRLMSKLLGCLRMYPRRLNKDTKVAI